MKPDDSGAEISKKFIKRALKSSIWNTSRETGCFLTRIAVLVFYCRNLGLCYWGESGFLPVSTERTYLYTGFQ